MTAISELEKPISLQQSPALPTNLAEFLEWEPEDGFKYEWNDGEIIQFNGIDIKQLFIFEAINDLFIEKGIWKKGTLVAEQNIMLNGIQLRRPDIAYFTKLQVRQGKSGEQEIPEFVIEIISTNDKSYKIEEKLTEYFKAGAGGVPLKVVWNIYPETKLIYVFTARKTVKICMEDDVCSAAPVLPEFEIKVSEILG